MWEDMSRMDEKIIPWYRMPLQLRALPFSERPKALAKWERTFGKYTPDNSQKTREKK
jgi:hypothetical protein